MRTCMTLFVLLMVMADGAGQAPSDQDTRSTWVYACSFPGIEQWEGAVRTYEGRYRGEFEGSHFVSKAGNCEVWLTGDICPIFAGGRCGKGDSVLADVAVEGVLSPSRPRGFGHMGIWERELRVTRVLSVTRLERNEPE